MISRLILGWYLLVRGPQRPSPRGAPVEGPEAHERSQNEQQSQQLTFLSNLAAVACGTLDGVGGRTIFVAAVNPRDGWTEA